MKNLISAICLAVLVTVNIFSQVLPHEISYQGVLKDASGVVVANGDYTLTFKLYEAESGGTEIWTETKLITVFDGVINTKLGSINPIVLPFDKTYWLGITIGTDSELNPRTKLSTVPYSYMSMNVMNGTINADHINNGQVVKSINTLRDDVNLVAGSNITITPSGNNLTISAPGLGSGTIGGSGTTTYIPVFTGALQIGNSIISQKYNKISIGLPSYDFIFNIKDDLSLNLNPMMNLHRAGTNSAVSIRFTDSENEFINIGMRGDKKFAISSLNYNIVVDDIVAVDGVQDFVGINTSYPVSDLDVNGTILISGANSHELNRTQTSNANLVPIAYGNVNPDGSVNTNATTSNVTLGKIGTGSYIITITGEYYTFSDYTCVASLVNSFGEICSSGLNGKLYILTANSAGTVTDKQFTFVIYKK